MWTKHDKATQPTISKWRLSTLKQSFQYQRGAWRSLKVLTPDLRTCESRFQKTSLSVCPRSPKVMGLWPCSVPPSRALVCFGTQNDANAFCILSSVGANCIEWYESKLLLLILGMSLVSKFVPWKCLGEKGPTSVSGDWGPLPVRHMFQIRHGHHEIKW